MEEHTFDNWKQIQTKTFTKWVNSKLKKAGFPLIESIFTDLSSGVALANLLSSLGKDMPKYNEVPHSRIKKMENLNIILEFIRSQNISLVNIGPEDIVDGDQKLILGLIWTLISKMAISSEVFSSEFLSLRDEVLGWAQRITSCYDHFKIENLTTHWQDGIAFNAIIHRFRPELVPDFYKLETTESIKNCDKAFKIAETNLDIPRLFDPEDIVDVIKPDEKSILTYLSQFYVKFSSEEQKINSKNNLITLFKGVNYSFETRNSYEALAKQFMSKKRHLENKAASIFNSLNSVMTEMNTLELMNSELISDSVHLCLLHDNIKDANNTFGLKEYVAPSELSIDKTEISYLDTKLIFDLNELKCSIDQFGNTEAKEIEKIAKMSRDIYILNKSEEMSDKMPSAVTFSSEHKQNAFNAIKEMHDQKAKKLKLFMELKANTKALILQAKKSFVSKDLKKTGFITCIEFMKILRSLGLETSNISKSYGKNSDKVSIESLEQEVANLSILQLSKEQIKHSFECVAEDLCVDIREILTGPIPKGLQGVVESDNGTISYESFINLFE